jgi:cation diffusion facilitator family transporter
MHSHSFEQWTHTHNFLGRRHSTNERRTWLVVSLTAAMMVAEIAGGTLFGSMALLADGWHMATHAAALGIAGAAYVYARKQAHNPRFSFGTGKIGELAAFSSAIILGLIACQIAFESATRLVHPVPIAYNEAIAVAVVGLLVNLFSAWLLRDQEHDHGHSHAHADHHDDDDDDDHDDHHPHHRDNNLRAAYIHVIADAATSVLAIAALFIAMFSQWVWVDPAVGIVGSLVIAVWAYGLIRNSGAVLLDVTQDHAVEKAIRERLSTDGDRISDLHLWQIGPGHCAAVVSIVSDHPQAPNVYKSRLSDVPRLSHVTVEVQACPDHAHHKLAG